MLLILLVNCVGFFWWGCLCCSSCWLFVLVFFKWVSMLLILLINCAVCVFFGVSLLLILSVFCVVFFWFVLGWEGGGLCCSSC